MSEDYSRPTPPGFTFLGASKTMKTVLQSYEGVTETNRDQGGMQNIVANIRAHRSISCFFFPSHLQWLGEVVEGHILCIIQQSHTNSQH